MNKRQKRSPQNEDGPGHRESSPSQAATIASEQEYWSRQVREAKKLNVISEFATGIAFIALLGVAYNACLVHKQVGVMQKQMGVMQKQVAMMRTANANNFEAFEDTERPWLSVGVAPAGDLSFVNGRQAALAIRVSITNVGKSIAKDVQVNAQLFPSPPGLPIAVDALRNQRKLCANVQPAAIGWFDLFPTDRPAERVMSISAAPSAIARQAVPSPGAKRRSFVGLYMVGCVTYRFSFGTESHQTIFAYQLIGPPIISPGGKLVVLASGEPLMTGFEVGSSVPEKRLHLMRELLGRNEAN